MNKNNYHTHTTRCMHAIGQDEEYVQAVKDRVHDYGKEGRYIAWYRENNEERRQKGYETMYTESRKFYCD